MPTDADRSRAAAIPLAFLLVLVSVARVIREQSIADDRARERGQWEQIEGGRRLMDEERSRLIERLDLALDAMQRNEQSARTHDGAPTAVREDLARPLVQLR